MQRGAVGPRSAGLPAMRSFCFSMGYWIPVSHYAECPTTLPVPPLTCPPSPYWVYTTPVLLSETPLLGGQTVDHSDKQNQTRHIVQGILVPSARPSCWRPGSRPGPGGW